MQEPPERRDGQPMLGFQLEDRGTVEIVRDGVLRLLTQRVNSAAEMISLGCLLGGLGRLPVSTPGLDVQLYFRCADDNTYFGVKLSEDQFLVGANTGGDELEINCLDTVILWVLGDHREGIEMPEVLDWLGQWEESTCQPGQVRQMLIQEDSTATVEDIVGLAGEHADESDWESLDEAEDDAD